MKYERMSKKQLLAAETFAYSYANYADHLGVNKRFDKYMPKDIDTIEKIVSAKKGAKELALKLGVTLDIAQDILTSYLTAKDIVTAKNAEASFRKGIKASILLSLESGLNSEEDIDKLVTQICYRTSDLAYLLDIEEKQLSDYSEELREEPDMD
ncbi:MAG: hypothetical protein HOM14_20510 [Gammaproteobacteria bacterium]|nr:hypothetical protein [Gammaproteobacteria bacterium]MBT3724885.1 hypothetical protein [Gammaproteobacteria bacterium]MBT4077305.1 hypothetical protein [Gammaproteobacteria bacterium]MBT4192960.1 hypothetical protein [Gammaproteobacteria bacterium]MBT4450888.1 hypothetical protein [Gammaproteobacteria bacterium]